MFQTEMFQDRLFKGAEHIGAGCFARVYRVRPGWVVKYAYDDGTRNYLEWCMREQSAGRKLQGMPEVDAVVPLEGGRYMAVLQECTGGTITSHFGIDHVFLYNNVERDLHLAEPLASLYGAYERPYYLLTLARAFAEYMQQTFGHDFWRSSDTHGGNFMFAADSAGSDILMLDPLSCPYYPSAKVGFFKLEG